MEPHEGHSMSGTDVVASGRDCGGSAFWLLLDLVGLGAGVGAGAGAGAGTGAGDGILACLDLEGSGDLGRCRRCCSWEMVMACRVICCAWKKEFPSA